MTDLAHDEPVLGPAIVTFDGHILEVEAAVAPASPPAAPAAA